MSDLINNYSIFKKLGFNRSNQWVFYDEQFHSFFTHFAENITDENLLSDKEILEYNAMNNRGEILSDNKRKQKLIQLEEDYPGLLECKEDVSKLINEIKTLEKAENMYADLIENMQNTKTKLICELTKVEKDVSELITSKKSTYLECLEKSKELEEIQKENQNLCNKATKCFTKMHTPPLFVHQLSLDHYFLKCDSFLRCLVLYITENFKIEDYLDLDESDIDGESKAEELEKLRKLHLHYNELLVKESAQFAGIESVIKSFQINQVHIINLQDMKKEIRELKAINNHYFNFTYETLISNLSIYLQQYTQQKIEFILYKNTKEKLNRVQKRKEKVEQLTKIVSDAMTNAELIWILIQLDLDKINNRFDNTKSINIEAQKCMRRIELMKNIQNSSLSQSNLVNFVLKMSEILSKHLNIKIQKTPRACLYEYEKICRMLKYNLQNVINNKSYTFIIIILHDIDQIEENLKPLVYNSPVKIPKIENVDILKQIYNARKMQINTDKKIRYLRFEFQEKIKEKMVKKKFWCHSQLLWIWFLTEPRRLKFAIKEVKKAAAKNPPMTGIKSFSGVKRK